MRRPIIRRGYSAHIGSAKLLRVLELRLEVERVALDAALDYGLDTLARDSAIRIVRLVREVIAKGGSLARIYDF